MSLKKTYCLVLAFLLPLLLSAQGIISGEEYIIKHVKTGKYLGGANIMKTPTKHANAMVLHHVSGNDIIYLLDERPVMTFSGEDVTFVIDTDTISYKSSEIQKVTYGYFDSSEYLPGDVNGSLDVTISDATTLIEYLNGRNSITINKRNADTNRNGMVDADDVKKTVRIIMKSK